MSKKVIIGVLIAVAALALFYFQRPAPQQGAAANKDSIRLADTSFQTLWINNAIASFIIEHGFGYPAEAVELTTPVALQSLENGQVDILMELWRNNSRDWYDKVIKEGTVLDLGETYEKSTQGFYVPRYVIEGDPDRGIEPMAPGLKTVFDLPKYKELFKDPANPGKGRIFNCIIGWQCQKINQIKMYAYGLADEYNMVEPGTAAALDSAIVGAFKKGEPIVAYYWEPTWLVGTYDLVQLEEPPYSTECDAEIQRALTGEIEPSEVSENAGCGYEQIGIHKGVTASLEERAPELVEFLKKMNVGTAPLNKTAGHMENEDASADEAAIWFFEQYQDRWREWLSDDVERKVEEALKEAGASL